MKHILITLFLFSQFAAIAQVNKMSKQAIILRQRYEAAVHQPHAPVLQIQFIDAFPDNKVDFIDIFNHHTQDQLAAKSVDYVKKFRKLGYDYTDSVLLKSIKIGKELTAWSEGPVDELQKTIYYLTNKDPMLFVVYVRELKKTEQATLAQFLRSGESAKEHVNYPTLLDIFDKADKRIYKIFAAAPLVTEAAEDEY